MVDRRFTAFLLTDKTLRTSAGKYFPAWYPVQKNNRFLNCPTEKGLSVVDKVKMRYSGVKFCIQG